MSTRGNPPDVVWLKAAAVGGLWAALEIVVGSYLHNLRLPLAGTVMSVLALCMLVATQQVWSQKGILWRAGLICALMKSISPSAVLLGPMIGIALQGAFMEAGIRLAGPCMAGYVAGGLLALTASFLQKLVRLVLIYGLDLVTVMGNAVGFTADRLGLDRLHLGYLLAGALAVQGLLALLVSFLGRAAGRRAASAVRRLPPLPADDRAPVNTPPMQPARLLPLLLPLHLGAAVLVLSLVHGAAGPARWVFPVLYLAACTHHYRGGLTALKRPALWIQILAIGMLAALFWNGFRRASVIDIEGARAGVTIALRAVTLVAAFTAISVELRHPAVAFFFMRHGSAPLYFSARLAFSALPSIVETLSRPGEMLRDPVAALARHVAAAESLLQRFREGTQRRIRAFVITGGRHQGKTAFARALVQAIRRRGCRVAGILSEKQGRGADDAAYRVIDLHTGESRPLCRRDAPPTWPHQGAFGFDPEALAFGSNALEPAPGAAEVVVVDEVGPLELRGLGWRNALESLLEKPIIPVLVVRKRCLGSILDHLNLRSASIMDIERTSVNEAADVIREAVTANVCTTQEPGQAQDMERA